MQPYIGITGFMSLDEVEEIMKLIPKNPSHALMVGVLASYRTLRCEPQKRPNRNPRLIDIQDIFPCRWLHRNGKRMTHNLVHYNTKDASSLADQLCKMARCSKSDCDGFQLNIAWPPQKELEKFLQQYMRRIVLQVGGRALKELEKSPTELANRIFDYYGLIDAVLLDMSGGLGRPLDANMLRPYLEKLRETWPDLGLGVAGGLSAETLHLVEPIIRDFPDVSIDAEGRLRDAEDRLDMEKAKTYFLGALEMFSKHRR